ncbi:hypothetical protein HUJ04_000374 [Dendroctonus ponderosae]|nr:hypothetical protein HUJ04_000374 [Dendroctonus ponderosae]
MDWPFCQYNGVYNQRQQRQPLNQYPGSGSCPEPNGTFPTSSCDGYIQCLNGVAEEKVCPDGILFNAEAASRAFPCQDPIDVDCTGRDQTQPAQATDECPHQFGYFRMGNQQNCGQFKNCVDGRGFNFDCPEAYLGFTCPPSARQFGLGPEEYRFFRSPSDCQRYYICIEGRPRLYNCGEGRAFNDLTNTCNGAENVTGCAGDLGATPTKPAKFSNQNAYNRFTSLRHCLRHFIGEASLYEFVEQKKV